MIRETVQLVKVFFMAVTDGYREFRYVMDCGIFEIRSKREINRRNCFRRR